MKELEMLLDRIIQRVNINLRELEFDVNPLVQNLIPPNQMTKFYAFYGITPHHPLNLQCQAESQPGPDCTQMGGVRGRRRRTADVE